MPRWFISDALKHANPTELLAYRALNTLNDDWLIRWTYYYNAGSTQCEGDFLILGPDGRLLVLEVKKRDRTFPSTGSSDGGAGDRSSDEVQVMSQKAGIVDALKAAMLSPDSSSYELPFVSAAIFSGIGDSVNLNRKTQPIPVIRGAGQLQRLPEYWQELTRSSTLTRDFHNVRRLFRKVYGDSSAEAESRFLSSTDRLMLDRLSADMSILDSLSENRQLLVRGGAGSGKTWLAERLAQNFAADDSRVLFLCYNKALGTGLRLDLPKLMQGKPGSIAVHTWESLAEHLIESLPQEKRALLPNRKQRDDDFYETTLPELMLEAVTSHSFKSEFDALVVDEAQDHNTEWWDIYFALLGEGAKSRIGVFYDPAQRPFFRSGSFDMDAIACSLSQPAHFTLRTTRRYTRPLFDFLKSLTSPETQALVDGLYDDGTLLTGPEAIHLPNHPDAQSAKQAASKLLSSWFKEKLSTPEDTLILTRKPPFGGKNSPGFFSPNETLAGHKLVPASNEAARQPGHLRVASFHTAKGLDARAVIMLDTEPWETIPPDERIGFWTAASRARQMLAAVEINNLSK